MENQELRFFLRHVGKDPSRLIFEDELTGLHNRRFLHSYFELKIPWNKIEKYPVSLLMMDVDRFKEINDTHGHGVGDLALTHIAGLLRRVSGRRGLPIRYAGDEFILLLPGQGKQAALQMGEKVMVGLHEAPFTVVDSEERLRLTLSIGAASAPDDARNGRSLLQRADAALYSAKKSGRDRMVNAGTIDPQDVFPRTALKQLETAKIAGRRAQLGQVGLALKQFTQKESRFLILTGSPGLGKTTFLETLRRTLAKSRFMQVKVSGNPQELFRPYYLVTSILIELLNMRKDKGAGVLDLMSPKEVWYLSHLLSQLKGGEEAVAEDEKTRREGIFNAVLHLIPKLTDGNPLIILVDDLHFADEATLFLFRLLQLRGDVPLFLCATVTEIQGKKGDTTAWGRFHAAYNEELKIQKVRLNALKAGDIEEHLQEIFPGIVLPASFSGDLAQVSQGNPLFLAGILSKLILDRKILLVGRDWVVEPLDEGYLPRSLGEIISEKVASLDEESRKLLDHVSAFGEKVSLSFVTGSSEKTEAQVLEFLDQAVNQGLISLDFQMNDDIVRFLGNRVQEIVYGGLQEDRKEELHEHIGSYQEALYKQRLLPSAAILAYHFQRSANLKKASVYEQVLSDYEHTVFNAEEAMGYTGEAAEEVPLADGPLDPESLEQIPGLIRFLLVAIRNTKLYPPGSKPVLSALDELKKSVEQTLKDRRLLTLSVDKEVLTANGEVLDVNEFKSIADAFSKLLNRLQLREIIFEQGLTHPEIESAFTGMARVRRREIHPQFWKQFCDEKLLTHVVLKQVQYAKREGVDGAEEDNSLGLRDRSPAEEKEMTEEDLAQVTQVIRCLLNAVSKMRLYPPEGTVTLEAIGQLSRALKAFLSRQPVLTLARVEESILVNGLRVDVTDLETTSEGLLRFLGAANLKSVSFLLIVTPRELVAFIDAVLQHSTEELGGDFWRNFPLKQVISGILFDKSLYEILEEQQARAEEEGTAKGEAEPHDAFEESEREAIPEHIRDLFLKGEEPQVSEILSRLFQGYLDGAVEARAEIIQLCRSMMAFPELSSQARFIRLMAAPMLEVFPKEKDSKVLGAMVGVLHDAGTQFIRLGEYSLASWVLLRLRDRFQALRTSREKQDGSLAKVLKIDLDAKIQLLLAEDLRSGNPSRQQKAAQLLGSLGPLATPIFLEIIKQDGEIRVRQMVAGLLGKMGPETVRVLKQELVLQNTPEERARVLEVIDAATSDLNMELPHVLFDESPKVRRAALRLAERLNTPEAVKLLLECAGRKEESLAVPAIRSLGKLKADIAAELFHSLLNTAKDPERLTACCKALGRMGNPESIEPLGLLLTRKGWLFFRKKPSETVRAEAALALAQIDHPRAMEILKSRQDDRDLRVREIARGVVEKGETPSVVRAEGARAGTPPGLIS